MSALDKLIETTKELPDARIEEVIKFVEWLKAREDAAFEPWLMTLSWEDWWSKAEDEVWAYLNEEPGTPNSPPNESVKHT
jgi:hypothetical protein